MHVLITIVHIIICIALIFIVLLQSSRGADMGAAFGGSSQTIFGSSGPGTFLGKITTVVAIIFMLTSLWLAYFAYHKTGTVMDSATVEQTAPVGEDTKGTATAPVDDAKSTTESKTDK